MTTNDIKNMSSKIFVPLLILVLFALMVGAVNTRDVVAELKLKMEIDDEREDDDKRQHRETKTVIAAFQKGQNEFKVQLKEFEINQQHILKASEENKAMTEKILGIVLELSK